MRRIHRFRPNFDTRHRSGAQGGDDRAEDCFADTRKVTLRRPPGPPAPARALPHLRNMDERDDLGPTLARFERPPIDIVAEIAAGVARQPDRKPRGPRRGPHSREWGAASKRRRGAADNEPL